jgi:uncharacterized protein YjbI with pentapeptide repeats
MRWREWLGVGERRWPKNADEEVLRPAKTLWDWLQLLIVPAILVAVTFAWSATQTRSDNRREDRRITADRAAAEKARQDATLQAYLDQMSGLMLHERLLISKRRDPVRAVARTITLATLRRLDGERKGEVIRFLYEARLLDIENPRVLLERANLTNAHLYGRFRGANLYNADLTDADLYAADLQGANLELTNLYGADLTFADLQGANLHDAIAQGVILKGAHLEGADLRYVDLKDADLGGAHLDDATILGGTRLEGANLALTEGLDLGQYITADRPPGRRKPFLDSQQTFLDSLSLEELAKFNLSPEKLAKLRREAKAD